MATVKDHIQAIRNRMHSRIVELERKLEKAREVYQSLQEAETFAVTDNLELLGEEPREEIGVVVRKHPEIVTLDAGRKVGRNEEFKENLVLYVRKHGDGKLEIPRIEEWMRERGIKGSRHSVQTYIHVSLKKKDFKDLGVIWHKGSGFFKDSSKVEERI